MIKNTKLNTRKPVIDRALCIAPMLDWTDRHCRYFHRLMSKHTVLYTEMVTTGALLHGKTERYIGFDVQEHPLALQLGGSNPADLAACSRIAENAGFDEVNLNVGCPSDRVQNGRFGACLMADAPLVAECFTAMQDAVSIPVTVKTRIGIDHQDSFEFLHGFISAVVAAGCQTVIIHARKAWLSGLSPKQNREIPPLDYPRVYAIKQHFPDLEIIINGGILSLEATQAHLRHVDGVMIGREAYHNPFILVDVDHLLYGDNENQMTRQDVIMAFLPYVVSQLQQGVRLNSMTRHILGLFHGQPGARLWRRHLSEHVNKAGADENTILQAMSLLR